MTSASGPAWLHYASKTDYSLERRAMCELVPPPMFSRQARAVSNPVQKLDRGGVFAAVPTNEIPKQAHLIQKARDRTFLVTFPDGFLVRPIHNESDRSIVCLASERCLFHEQAVQRVDYSSSYSGLYAAI